jgi:hypothetical protein
LRAPKPTHLGERLDVRHQRANPRGACRSEM